MKVDAVNGFVIQTINDMQQTNIDMINNKVKTAKFKLSQHKLQGESSSLSVYQVAILMDTVNKGFDNADANQSTIFFSLN